MTDRYDWHDWNAEERRSVLKEWPAKWHAVYYRHHEYVDPEDDIWTISPDPERTGWNTDAGFSGYGLPREIAEKVVEVLNQWEAEKPVQFTGEEGTQPPGWKVVDNNISGRFAWTEDTRAFWFGMSGRRVNGGGASPCSRDTKARFGQSTKVSGGALLQGCHRRRELNETKPRVHRACGGGPGREAQVSLHQVRTDMGAAVMTAGRGDR